MVAIPISAVIGAPVSGSLGPWKDLGPRGWDRLFICEASRWARWVVAGGPIPRTVPRKADSLDADEERLIDRLPAPSGWSGRSTPNTPYRRR